MFKKIIKSRKAIISTILMFCLIVSTVLVSFSVVYAQENISKTAMLPKDKIDNELQTIMDNMSDDDLISIWLWRKDIDAEIITEALIEERGLNPTVYEDENRFYEEIVPEIIQQIENRVGYEEAHKIVLSDEVMSTNEKKYFKELYEASEISMKFNEDDDACFDRSISLVDRAVHAKVDEYLVAYREVTNREYSDANNDFINENIKNNRKILYNGKFTSTIILEATKAEIEVLATNETITRISLFVDFLLEPCMNVVTPQVNSDNVTGTKSSNFNKGTGYKGTGVNIGIIEADTAGSYDQNIPQFSNIHNVRLFKPSNITGTTSVSSDHHASLVTSIIVGQSLPFGNLTFEGIAPLATVYQVNPSSQTETSAIDNLTSIIKVLISAPYSVNVINFSATISLNGTTTGLAYTSIENEIDKTLANAKVTFVSGAGNVGRPNNFVGSPAKALNVITVGNAKTSKQTSPLAMPYNVADGSSFRLNSYLPNKPDIVAPGENIRYPNVNNGHYLSGTSFATPIVTGIVAQMMQANPWLKTNPLAVKAKLLLGADYSKISSTDNAVATNSQYLREMSGAGLVDAIESVKGSLDLSFSVNSLANQNSSQYYLSSGHKIRAVMVYNKLHTKLIESTNDMDIINFYLKNSNGSVVASSISNRNNVRIIEYTVPTNGYYYFCIEPIQLIKNEGESNCAGVDVYVSARIPNTVTFDKTYEVSNVTMNYGLDMPALDTVPTFTNYVFGGYYDDQKTQYYYTGGTAVQKWNKTQNTTLSARWIPITYKLGDADGNGIISIADVTEIQKHCAKLTTLTGNKLLAADVNYNEKVDVSDATKIQYALSKSNSTDYL